MLLLLLACADDKTLDSAGRDSPSESDTDTDTDTDADTDTDTDSDTDTDTDTDADTDADTDTLDYGMGDGPYRVDVQEDRIDGQDVTWYVPQGSGPWPALIWSHGFARGQDNHATAAARAATWGFVVVTPSLPNFSDHEANGEWLATEVLPEAEAMGGVGDDRIGYVGHSAGGLASLVAASMSDVGVYVGLDAVDVSDIGIGAAPSVDEPALLLHGEESYCNSDTNSRAWELGGPVWQVDVIDATHCDFESDTDWVCTAACGSEDAGRQEIIQAYAVAWALQTLDGSAPDWVEGGDRAEADRAAGRIDW